MADRNTPHSETKCEAMVREAFKATGIKYEQEVNVKGYMVDFVVGEKIAVEIDGYYHAAKDVIYRDIRKEKLLEELGYRVVRISNEEVKNPRELKRHIAEIKQAINEELAVKRQSVMISTPLNTPAMKGLMDKMNSESNRKKESTSDEDLFKKWLDKDPRTSRRK